VQTTITSIHVTNRHDTIVNVMFTQVFYLLTITKLQHPDTASSLILIDNLISISIIIIFVCCLSLRELSPSHSHHSPYKRLGNIKIDNKKNELNIENFMYSIFLQSTVQGQLYSQGQK
jgi:hypothetical protein